MMSSPATPARTVAFFGLALGLAGAFGCGDGGNPSPTASSPPSGPPSVGGTYGGLAIYSAASPAEHCFATGLRRLGGHAFRMRAVVNQQGSMLAGSLDGTQIDIACGFEGSVSADGAIRWSQTTCDDPCASFLFTIEADGPCNIQACRTDHTFEGSVQNGNGNLQGNLELEWETADATSGAPLGTILIRARLDIPRTAN